MKSVHRSIIALLIAAMLSAMSSVPCAAAEGDGEQAGSMVSQEEPPAGDEAPNPDPETIGQMMDRLAEVNPGAAEELSQLEQREPDRFAGELGQALRRHRTKGLREHGPNQPPPGQEGGRPNQRLMQMEKDYLKWLHDNYPQEAQRLQTWKQDKPELYARHLRSGMRMYRRIMDAAEDNPELAQVLKTDFELTERQEKLLQQLKGTTNDEEKQKLIQQLQGVVSDRFDLIVKRTQIEYQQVEKRIRELEKEIKQRQAQIEKWKSEKDAKVKERLQELLSRSEKFRWD